MLRYFLILVMVSLGINTLYAQFEPRKCATHILEQKDLGKSPRLKAEFEKSINSFIQKRKLARVSEYELINIPVVVHILHPNLALGIKQNLKDEVIQSQIQALNRDFGKQNSDTTNTPPEFKGIASDTRIQFCLATVNPDCNPTNGIVRVPNAKASYNIDEIDTLKKLSYWPSDEYLNIWITDLESGYIGYSKFPYGTSLPGLEDGNFNQDPRFDGVVIDYTTFGTIGPNLKKNYNLGRTATHEIGHWLGLRHTWGDDNCGTDYCDDTPEQVSSTDGCTRAQACDISDFAMMENFLDYTYDACMSIFTKDQTDRMRAVLEQCVARKTLVTKNSCSKTPEFSYTPDFEGFDTDSIHSYILPSKKGLLSSVGAYNASKASLKFVSDTSFEIIQTKKLKLINPKINYLNFDVVLINKTNAVLDGDLVISYQIGCTGIWTKFVTFPASQILASSGQNLPLSSDWTNKQLNLTLMKSDLLKLKFDYVNRSANIVELYIDNLFFNENKSSSLDIYYNEENKKLNFIPKHIGLKDLDVKIYSTNGTLSFSREFNQISSTSISLTDIMKPNQMYIVKAQYDGHMYTYKFVYVQ